MFVYMILTLFLMSYTFTLFPDASCLFFPHTVENYVYTNGFLILVSIINAMALITKL
jgi:hypothetical protein